MWLVFDGLPIATPLETQIHANRADRFVFRRFGNVFAAFKNANVEGDAEIVIGVAAACICDFLSRFAPSLFV